MLMYSPAQALAEQAMGVDESQGDLPAPLYVAGAAHACCHCSECAVLVGMLAERAAPWDTSSLVQSVCAGHHVPV